MPSVSIFEIVVITIVCLYLTGLFINTKQEKYFQLPRKISRNNAFFSDFIIRPFFTVLLEPFTKKNTYWWNWQIMALPQVTELSFVYTGDERSTKDRKTSWRMFWQTCFGWKKVLVFSVENIDGSQYKGSYFIAWSENDNSTKNFNGRVELCNLLINNYEVTKDYSRQRRIAMLVGSQRVSFYAYSHDFEPLKLIFHHSCSKNFAKASHDTIIL